MSQNRQIDPDTKDGLARGCLEKLYKNALVIILALFVGLVVFSLARASVYKIRPYEKGLHLRGGKFIDIDEPGWHMQITGGGAAHHPPGIGSEGDAG